MTDQGTKNGGRKLKEQSDSTSTGLTAAGALLEGLIELEGPIELAPSGTRPLG